MDERKKNCSCGKNKKSATDNQWDSTGIHKPSDKSERKDGPSGEDADF